MYEDETTYVEGSLSGNTEDDEEPAMYTELYCKVPTSKVNDDYINASVMLPTRNSYSRGKFIGRKRDADGNSIGRKNDNPILYTSEYCVEFDDGEVRELTGKLITDSMYAACDDSGNNYLMMYLIVDYRKSNKDLSVVIQKVVHRGRSFMQRPTVLWQLCVQWRYGLPSWKTSKDLKEYHLVETEEYDVAHEIYHEPSFNWWVKSVLKERSRIISLVKKRNTQYLKKTHNFEIEVPKLVA